MVVARRVVELGRGRALLARALFLAVAMASAACAPEEVAPVDTRIAALSPPDGAAPGSLDILFMIDDAPGMGEMQAKLAQQIPGFIKVLASQVNGMPDLHIAVVSSDMGAHSENPDKTGCTQTGDQGVFHAEPQGICTDSTLVTSAAFISNSDGVANYGARTTTPDISQVVACILPLGEGGCRFVSPLASIARALGADGAPAPMSNAGFLRQDAMLAIIILTNQDDCSASGPSMTALYSLNSGPDDLVNSLGPLTTYRCNEFGHLCVDPHGNTPEEPPPEATPSDADGPATAPTLNLATCRSNDTGLLASVATYVQEIRALKTDPDRQIAVGAIVAPPTPYTVAWIPASDPTQAPEGQLWPSVEHSCGPMGAPGTNPNATQLPIDGSFGDPAVRLTQFVKGFGANGFLGSVCDASYAGMMGPLADFIASNVPLSGNGSSGAGGAVYVDGSAGADGGLTGAGGVTGAGSSGTGGVPVPSGVGGVGGHGSGVPPGVPEIASGLQPGGCVCSVGASPPLGSCLAVPLVVLILARRRGRGARKNLT